MSIVGNIANTGSVIVGQSFQSDTLGNVDVYCQILCDQIGEETSDGVTLNYAASFLYGGYENVVPFEVGCFVIHEGATDVDWDLTNPLKKQTLFTIESSMNWNPWWFGELESDNQTAATRFIERSRQYNLGVLPYVKIGGIPYGQTGPGGCGPWDAFNTEYGVLCPRTVTENANWRWGSTFTFNGITREDLFCWCVVGGLNDTTTLSYENCPIKLQKKASIYVKDSSGEYKPSTALYLYNEEGVLKKASTLTIYDAEGKAKTVYV